MAHEQQISCMHCQHSFRACLDTTENPPDANSIYEVECPNCNRITNTMPTAGTQRESCSDDLPIGRKVVK